MFCIALVSFCHMSDKGLFSGISCLTELTNIWSEPSMCQNMSFHIGFDYSLNKSFHYFYTNWTLEDVFAANQRWDFNWFKFNLQITKSMIFFFAIFLRNNNLYFSDLFLNLLYITTNLSDLLYHENSLYVFSNFVSLYKSCHKHHI